MADALLSADHFYVNASYYNDTDTVQKASITVKDTTNILDRSDDWLVHVTRFSVDSMRSLSYIETDLSAYWEIRLHNEQQVSTNTYNFVLDRDYATPQDLIEAMNMGGATRRVTSTIYSAYRFELDAGGRFRLTGPETTNAYISYTGSAAMNVLLGFDTVTPTIRFTPSPTDQYARLVDYLHAQALSLATPTNLFNGTYHSAINNILVHLLNGIKVYTAQMSSTNPVAVNQDYNTPIVADHAGLSAFDVIHRYYEFKGTTPTVQRASSEALLPQGDVPVLIEYWDRPQGPHVQNDGFRARVVRLDYISGYSATGDQRTTGYAQFRNIANTTLVTPTSYPTYKPQSPGVLATYQYLYPMESIAGYNISGYGNWGSVGSVAVAPLSALDGITLENAIPNCVEAGDDVWFEDSVPWLVPATITMSAASRTPYIVRHITSIAEDRMSCILDQGISARHWVSTHVNQQAQPFNCMFTNRRVPFQSRSRCHVGCLDHGRSSTTGGLSWVHFTHAGPMAVGDVFHWVVNGVMEPTSYTVTDASGFNNFRYSGPLPALVEAAVYAVPPVFNYINDNTGIFVVKRAADVQRWARDAELLKMSSTTFSYQVGSHGAGTATQSRYPIVTYPGLQANGVNYPERYQQSYYADCENQGCNNGRIIVFG